jgi:ABC-type Fe3+ transport system substrate-binding protein
MRARSSRRVVALALASLLGVSAAAVAHAADRLVVLSPHRKTIQAELMPMFQAYYLQRFGTPVEVEWVDQGGTSNAVRFLKAKAQATPDKVGVDVFWGGTAANFVDMADAGLLAPYALPAAVRAGVPREIAGVPLSDPKDRWHAVVLSSFGIMFNKKVLSLDGLPEPRTWADLADARWRDRLSLTDPRKSGTNSTMNQLVLTSSGWAPGWAQLTRIAANTRRFADSSSDPVHAVAAGDAAAAMVIDFYGLSQVWELGPERVGFVLPPKATVLDPDPVALVRGGEHVQVAQRFVDYLLSLPAQKVWLLPKGTEGGPKLAPLARLAVLPQAYAETEGKRLGLVDPFRAPKDQFMRLDLAKAGREREVLNDLYGAVLVDLHAPLKAAWAKALAAGEGSPAVAALLAPPVSEAEVRKLAETWGDERVRNAALNQWVAEAKSRYEAIAKGESPKAH